MVGLLSSSCQWLKSHIVLINRSSTQNDTIKILNVFQVHSIIFFFSFQKHMLTPSIHFPLISPTCCLRSCGRRIISVSKCQLKWNIYISQHIMCKCAADLSSDLDTRVGLQRQPSTSLDLELAPWWLTLPDPTPCRHDSNLGTSLVCQSCHLPDSLPASQSEAQMGEGNDF